MSGRGYKLLQSRFSVFISCLLADLYKDFQSSCQSVAFLHVAKLEPSTTPPDIPDSVKMRTLFILPALVSTAAARIAGVAAPSQIAAGSDVQITIITENYIQSVLDVSAAFGLSQTVSPDTLGNYLTSFYIGPGMPVHDEFFRSSLLKSRRPIQHPHKHQLYSHCATLDSVRPNAS